MTNRLSLDIFILPPRGLSEAASQASLPPCYKIDYVDGGFAVNLLSIAH
jgi:hypothetical protein